MDEVDLDDDEEVSEEDIKLHIGVHIHEIGHILGISTSNFEHYRKPNGEPWGTTERTVACADGDEETFDVPNILTEVDGIWEITSLTVQQVVRNQFDCQSLTGARLENQSSSNCFSSHLDEVSTRSSLDFLNVPKKRLNVTHYLFSYCILVLRNVALLLQ